MHSSVFEEIHEHRSFLKKEFIQPILYGAHYYLISIQSYKMLLEDFSLPSLSLLSKFIKRKIDAIKYTQALKKDGKISEDIYLMKCIYENMRVILEVN